MFRDNYTDFSFNEIRSSNFKVWITNKNDLKRDMSPNFSDKFNSPTYGQLRYHEGTTMDKQDFKLSCVAVNITLNEWRAICEWLSPLKSGKLRFDWNEKYYYMVKLSKAPSGAMFIKSRVDNIMGDLYIVEFTLEFTTIYDWAAIGPTAWWSSNDNKNNYIMSNCNNSYYMPTIAKANSETSFGAYYVIENAPSDESSIIFQLRDGGYYYLKIALSNGSWIATPYSDKNCEKELTGKFAVEFPFLLPCNTWSSLEDVNTVVKTAWTTLSNASTFLIANAGSYKMYPELLLDKETTIYNGFEEKLYSFRPKDESPAFYTIVDFKNGTIALNKEPINDTYYNMDKEHYTNTGENGIESGRPELWKVYVVSYTNNKLTVLLNSKPIYSREKPFLFHIFTKELVNEANVFDQTLYDKGIYTYDKSELGSRKLLFNPSYEVKYDSNYKCWSIVIDTNQNCFKEYTEWDEVTLKTGDYLYFSLCDCEQLICQTEGNILMSCYPRDVI